ncbi:hypothetical protein FT663_01361 [Candidozyma haemuli var. vulneris]|nr:hypothetical protein FT663_01361 [[Candida] haemuloni var. vulneris]
MESDNDDTSPSLYFASTQIQSRHEDLERKERSLSKLQKFKNESPTQHKTSEMTMNKPRKKAKPKKPTLKTKKPPTSSLSLNSFVKEMFKNKKTPDPSSILDYFAGDAGKVDEFLQKVETASGLVTNGTQLSDVSSFVHSKKEWEGLLKSIRLRFPDLSKKNQRTLSKISQQLKSLRQPSVSSTDESQSIWSKASRQPSDDLTTEDVKWLYDLDSEKVNEIDTSALHLTEDEDEEKPFYLTLSQAMNDPKSTESDEEDEIEQNAYEEDEEEQKNDEERKEDEAQEDDDDLNHTIHSIRSQSPILISDSESEPEPYILSKQLGSLEDIPSRQEAGPPESVDLLTSIAFNSKNSKEETMVGTQTQPLVIEEKPKSPVKSNGGVIFSSPVKPELSKKPHTPTRWPSNLVITSSPVSSGKESVTPGQKIDDEEHFSTARSVLDDDNYESQFSGLPEIQSSMPSPKRNRLARKRSYMTTTLEYRGNIELPVEVSNDIKMRKITATSAEDNIPDSEESDCEVSLIEISKPSDPIEPPQPRKMPSVLQVPSSPRLTTQSDSYTKLTQMSMKDVRQVYSHLGLAPTKLKATMAEAIEYAAELTGTSIDDLTDAKNMNEEESRMFGKRFIEMTYDKITNSIKMSESLHLKIALFEPIKVETLNQHLKEEEVFPINLDLPFLQKYCDTKGVTTTNAPL